MKNKFILGILIAIISIMYISTIFGMMYYSYGMDKGYSNKNQISGYGHNSLMRNIYISSPYANHMDWNRFSYIGNRFSNNMMRNNWGHMKYGYSYLRMM